MLFRTHAEHVRDACGTRSERMRNTLHKHTEQKRKGFKQFITFK